MAVTDLLFMVLLYIVIAFKLVKFSLFACNAMLFYFRKTSP